MSVTVKIFHRKTKTGSIIKVVREHYLRDDIHCGRDSCPECQPNKPSADSPFAPKSYLSDVPRKGLSQLCPSPHYVIPDFGTLQNQTDIITDADFGCDIILMQTIWDEVKRNIAVFSRIKQMMSEKRFFVFLNEYNKNTFSERISGETIAEYKQRLVISAAEWLQNHFNEDIKIVYLINCNQIKQKTEILCIPIDKYVKSLTKCPHLSDKLADMSETGEYARDARLIYDEHLALDVVQQGIINKKYYQGKFNTNQYNYLEAEVAITKDGKELFVLIQGSAHINRAVHEDIVAIELLEESGSKSDVVLEVNEDIEDEGDNKTDKQEVKLFSKKIDDSVVRPVGRVVAIIKRNWRQYCGVLRERNPNINTSSVMNRYLFVPMEKRIPIIRIETRQYEHLKGQRIIVAIDSWPRDSKYPKGHYVRSLGGIGDKTTETEVILLEKDVPHLEFSKAVMNCLPKEGENWKISEEDLIGRTDLRNEFICSVDPPGCTDIDDALHCKDIGNGLYEIGVHIADVSHFIKPKTALDTEAADRGTSVYLVRQRIDMIPPLLSSNLCSLRQDVERLTFSVLWIMDSNTAEVKSTRFVKSVIKSKAAMTYAEAQMKINSPEDKSEIANGLRRLNKIAKILKQKRLDDGALVLASANEIRFVEMDSETHENPILEIQAKELLETNSMVEEFMLMANCAVAEKIFQEFPELALLRRHPKPSEANFEELIIAAKRYGFEMDVSDGKRFGECLNKIRDSKNPMMNLIIRIMATRCMSQALYFCTGSLKESEDAFSHFGLAKKYYTHFTSPIRRYADLMVHRLLSHAIEFEAIDSSLLRKQKMQAICDNINYRNKNAREASRESNKLHSYLFVRNNVNPFVDEEGYVMYVKKNAIIFFIPHLAMEVPFFMRPEEDWKYDEMELTQEYLPKNKKLKWFDAVTIRLSVNKELTFSYQRGIDVQLLKPFSVEAIERTTKKLKT